jgi:type I restriction enzyme S subunit
MELRAGYKQTEVGVIPDDWGVASLSEIATKVTDGEHITPRREKTGYFLLSARNVLNGRIDTSDVDFVGRIEFLRIRERCNPEYGDVLISCSGTIGRVSVVPTDFECVLVRSAALVKPNFRKVNSHFIQYWLQGSSGQKQIGNSVNQGAQPNLFLNHIERLKTPTPPLPEQRAIATALSDVDALLAKIDQLIAKKRDLKQAAMQQLLTGQTRLPGFSGVWEVKRLGDVATANKGSQLSSSESSDSGNYAHLNGGVTPSSYTANANTPGETIAISEGGNSCGFVQFMKEPYWCGGHCYSVIPRGVEMAYLYQALKGRQSEIMGLRVGSGLPNIKKSALLNFVVSLPTGKKEQTAIAKVLSDMDAELAAQEARRDKTRALKQGMMQALLTGRIRLVWVN